MTRILLSLTLVLGFAGVTDPATALQADEAPNDPKAELEELGLTLRAAVMSGAMDAEEAREIYRAVEASLVARFEQTTSEGDREPEPDDPKGRVMRLATPEIGRINVLFQPEFLGRDLTILRDELDLDAGQMAIVETLLRDYRDGLEVASLPLRESLERYRRETRHARIASALEGTAERLEEARPEDTAAAVDRIRATLDRIVGENAERLASASGERRREVGAWMERMIDVTEELDERLASISGRVSAELAALDRSDATVTAHDLVRMATRLRAERDALRGDMTTALELITTDEQRGEDDADLEAALARVRIDHLLPQGRLGGESMNLWGAMNEAGRGELEYAQTLLRRRAASIADLLDARADVAIEREIEGLEFEAERERLAAARGGSVFELDETRVRSALRPYAEAARREVGASVAVRDELRALLDESALHVEEMDPDSDLADIYREAALRRGFPAEMRRRWSEIAVERALAIEGLDEDTRDALVAVEMQNRLELATTRADAIATCIDRDPRMARAFIEARLSGDEKGDVEWTPDMWLGINHEAFADIDERTETQLRDILNPDQFATLPLSERARRERAERRSREREAYVADLRARVEAGEITGEEARRDYRERFPEGDK